MFWKKTKAPGNAVSSIDQTDQRASFRYVFSGNTQLAIKFKGREVNLTDISAGGLGFSNPGAKQYDSDKISLILNMPNFTGDPALNVQIRILHISANQICHCIFENCTVQEYEVIHKFVLEMQKQDLKKR
ncbi:MAG: PilZ domain-containing protein [Desulfobacter sp.]|nr:MAG: PilZ domain-containing protein [Desulfobacter sp.]